MAIKVNARETELKIGKNPGYYYGDNTGDGCDGNAVVAKWTRTRE